MAHHPNQPEATKLYTEAALRAELETTLAELEEAESLIRKASGSKVYITLAGGICIELSREEALEYIAERKARLRALLSSLQGASE